MKFHIVRNGETAKDIMFIYSLDFDELKEVNRHISDWKKLIPGVKLKIPVITEAIDQDIMDMEPFVEDYYPRKPITFDNEPIVNNNNLNDESKIEEEAVEFNNDVVIDKKEIDDQNDINDQKVINKKEEVKEIITEDKEQVRDNKEYDSIKNNNYQTKIKMESNSPQIIYVPVYYYVPYYYPYYPTNNKKS